MKRSPRPLLQWRCGRTFHLQSSESYFCTYYLRVVESIRIKHPICLFMFRTIQCWKSWLKGSVPFYEVRFESYISVLHSIRIKHQIFLFVPRHTMLDPVVESQSHVLHFFFRLFVISTVRFDLRFQEFLSGLEYLDDVNYTSVVQQTEQVKKKKECSQYFSQDYASIRRVVQSLPYALISEFRKFLTGLESLDDVNYTNICATEELKAV